MTDWPVYQDTLYHFQISYPPQFEFKLLDNAELDKLKPEPVTATYFNDPPTNLGGLVPPKFSIRIYKIGAGTSVENWLKTNGLYLPDSDWTIAEIPGRTFLRLPGEFVLSIWPPAVFIYAVQGDYLFQLTPLGQDAEKMLTTFEFTRRVAWRPNRRALLIGALEMRPISGGLFQQGLNFVPQTRCGLMDPPGNRRWMPSKSSPFSGITLNLPCETSHCTPLRTVMARCAVAVSSSE